LINPDCGRLQGKPVGNIMNLNFTFVLQIISFLILLGALAKFLYKPLINYLDERSQNVKNMIESARTAENKAKAYSDETKEALEKARLESARIRREAKALADGERRRVIEEAKKEARFLMEKTMGQLGREKEELLKKIRKDIAEISIGIATRILSKEISKADHEKIINASISELEDEISRP